MITILSVVCCLMVGTMTSSAQTPTTPVRHLSPKEIGEEDADTLAVTVPAAPVADSLDKPLAKVSVASDTVGHHKRDWATWKPSAKRALWLALVLPGAGQIYNRKYWKLPIVYGGFVGCAYALDWNNKMYKDYSQAYLDIMDDDPNTKSYQDFLPLNSSIAGQEERFKEIFRKRKDVYRRQRDLSIFAFIGVYLLSIIDAYVDAELSDFDISNDIGLHVEPALFDNGHNKYNSVGLQCSLKF